MCTHLKHCLSLIHLFVPNDCTLLKYKKANFFEQIFAKSYTLPLNIRPLLMRKLWNALRWNDLYLRNQLEIGFRRNAVASILILNVSVVFNYLGPLCISKTCTVKWIWDRSIFSIIKPSFDIALFHYFWKFTQICKKFFLLLFLGVARLKLFRNNNKNNFVFICCKFLANLCKSMSCQLMAWLKNIWICLIFI